MLEAIYMVISYFYLVFKSWLPFNMLILTRLKYEVTDTNLSLNRIPFISIIIGSVGITEWFLVSWYHALGVTCYAFLKALFIYFQAFILYGYTERDKRLSLSLNVLFLEIEHRVSIVFVWVMLQLLVSLQEKFFYQFVWYLFPVFLLQIQILWVLLNNTDLRMIYEEVLNENLRHR